MTLLGCSLAAYADNVAPVLVGKMVLAISSFTEAKGRIACQDPARTAIFKKVGLTVDDLAPLAWASTKTEVEQYTQAGKLVITDQEENVPSGAAFLLDHEGGKPVYYIYASRVRSSKIYVGSAVWKFAKELR